MSTLAMIGTIILGFWAFMVVIGLLLVIYAVWTSEMDPYENDGEYLS